MLNSAKTLFSGQVITLKQEQVTLPNGVECELEILHHPGGVGVVAINAQGQLCLLQQYRHAAGGWLWEIPAGKIEAGEEISVTASRELEEEAGVKCGQLQLLGKTITSPGVLTEVIHLYLARELTPAAQSLEAEEVIQVNWITFAQAMLWIADGKIYDAKSVIGIMLAQQYLSAHE